MNSYCIIRCNFSLSAVQKKNDWQDYFAIITNIFRENEVIFNINNSRPKKRIIYPLANTQEHRKSHEFEFDEKMVFDKTTIIRHMQM